ncbi:MAG: NAD(P)H-dependent oxidoreductase [Clostridiales Family XIII bacterium]|jgi:multimeric flavodoxin WrbA|nr:NAD(P)H-dependent oxidoreductase [Clostridiales Family XIII bacterium]
MKIVLINGSPKTKRSISGTLLGALSEHLPPEAERAQLHVIGAGGAEARAAIAGADVWVLAFPLYIDGLPSHLIRFLERAVVGEVVPKQGAVVYTLVNNGFYEPEQCKNAVAAVKLFCNKAGLFWGQAVCVGAGPMAGFMPLEKRPMAPVASALGEFAVSISTVATGEDLYVRPNVARFLYVKSAHAGWKKAAEKAGFSLSDLRRLPG